MNFKSQKLTNILLLIITAILVLALVWAICKGVSAHRGADGRFNKYNAEWGMEKCSLWLEKGEHKEECQNKETCDKHQEELAE